MHNGHAEYFETDTLSLEEHFGSWHTPHPEFPFMSLRYETERNHLKLLKNFLGLPQEFTLPEKKAGEIGAVPRSERLARLTDAQRTGLAKTYSRLKRSVDAAPDACVWGT